MCKRMRKPASEGVGSLLLWFSEIEAREMEFGGIGPVWHEGREAVLVLNRNYGI